MHTYHDVEHDATLGQKVAWNAYKIAYEGLGGIAERLDPGLAPGIDVGKEAVENAVDTATAPYYTSEIASTTIYNMPVERVPTTITPHTAPAVPQPGNT
jgi:nitrogen regulatory protein PII